MKSHCTPIRRAKARQTNKQKKKAQYWQVCGTTGREAGENIKCHFAFHFVCYFVR